MPFTIYHLPFIYMAAIALEGMKFYAYHGVYEEERILGGEYVVDVYITTVFAKAAIDDDLYKTINYETIYLICQIAMRKPSKLVEAVAERIGLGIRNQFKNISELNIRVAKLHPPLGGRVFQAVIETEGNYTKRCARCEKPLLCYGDGTCWCMDTRIFQKTLEHVQTHYGDKCLCGDCLNYFAS